MKAELVLSLLLAAGPAFARSRAPRAALPDADELLARVYAFPSAGCVAHGRIQFFHAGAKTKGLGTVVYTLPDGRLRREIREKGPRKPPTSVIVDDGKTLSLLLLKVSRIWTGEIERESRDEQTARLKSIYAISVSTGGRVAKHATWRLDLRAPGGPLRRSLWVDRASGLLLKTEMYRYDGSLARRDRIVRLVTPTYVDPKFFDPIPREEGFHVVPLVPKDPPVPGGDWRFPRWAPLGFLPVEAGAREHGAVIRYDDGAASFTVLQAPGGAESGIDENGGRMVKLKDGSRGLLVPAGLGAALVRRTPSSLLVVSGDLADEELVRVAESAL